MNQNTYAAQEWKSEKLQRETENWKNWNASAGMKNAWRNCERDNEKRERKRDNNNEKNNR